MKKVFSDNTLLGLTPGKYTDAACRGLRAVVTDKGSLMFEVRHRDGRSERIGEFVRPVPQPGEVGYARHMTIKAARLEADSRRENARRVDAADHITFREDMETYLAAQKWKPRRGDTNHRLWRSRMELHCQTLMTRPTASLTTADIAEVIRAAMARRDIIRKGQPCDMVPTGRWLRHFIGKIIDYAMHGPTKTRWAANTANPCAELKYHVTIPALNKRRQKHHAAMSLHTDEHGPGIQEFYRRLVRHPRRTRTVKAIRFLLLTLCPRVGEVMQMTWGQLHLLRPDPEWHIPDAAMKTSKDRPQGVRIVPLNKKACDLLWSFRPDNPLPTDYVFPGVKGGPLSDNAMRALLRVWGITDATLHGFRTALTDWVANNHPDLNEAVEIALDHTISLSASRPAYHTTSLLIPRRVLADLWANFLEEQVSPSHSISAR